MAVPLLPIIMAVTSLGLGVAQGISSASQSKSQMKEDAKQTQLHINERAREAKKLISQQKTSFLKSGVYFEGTPEAVFQETSDIAIKDMQAMSDDSTTRQKNLQRQGRTGFYSGVVSGILGAASMFTGLGGMAGAGAGISLADNTKNTFYNNYQKLRGWNKGGFGGSTISGIENV